MHCLCMCVCVCVFVHVFSCDSQCLHLAVSDVSSTVTLNKLHQFRQSQYEFGEAREEYSFLYV